MIEYMYILFFTSAILKSCYCEPQLGTSLRTDGEDFIDYLRRVDAYYCHDGFCSESGVTGRGSNVKSSCDNICPHRCQCDSQCVIYGDCCPDYHNGTYLPVNNGMYSCLSDYLKPHTGSTNFQILTECPQVYENPDIIKMCKISKLSNKLNFRTFVSTNDGVTYGNAYCAICNGKNVFDIWKMQGVCDRQVHIPSTLNPGDLIKLVWHEDGCNFKQTTLSQGLNIRRCGADENHIVSACNVTGEWAQSNADVERACLNYTHVFAKYRNPFCYICNSATEDFNNNKCAEPPPMRQQLFSARLDITQDVYIQQPRCQRGYAFDAIEEKCREIYCIDGKWLMDESKCVTVIRPPPNSVYGLSIFYTTNIVLHDVHCLEFIPNQSSFSELSDKLLQAIFAFKGVSSNFKPLTIKTSAMLINKGDLYCGQDGLFNITSEYNVKWIMVNLTLVSLDHLDVDVLEETLFNSTLRTHTLDIEGFGNVLLTSMHRMTNITDLQFVRIIPMKQVVHWVANSGVEIEITKQRTCPFIILREGEYQLIGNGSVLHIPALDYYVPPEDYQFINMSHVRVCTYDYFRQMMETTSPDKQVSDVTISVSTTILHKYITDDDDLFSKPSRDRHVTATSIQMSDTVDVDVPSTSAVTSPSAASELCKMVPVKDEVLKELSIICICLSGLCLLITLVVYSMFKPLRTFQGILNMVLVVSLLLAQTSQAITPNQDAAHVLHVISGIASHYLWIATILWLNVCSFNVLRSFGPTCIASTTNKTKLKVGTLLLYLAYCLIIPAIFVGINVAISMEVFENMGYNRLICITSNPILLGTTFTLPITIALIFNVSMFCVFVISDSTRFQSLTARGPDSQYPQLYFGLTLTAFAMWLCSFLYQYLGYTIYDYLFTFLNTLQGILIFLICVCNSTTCGILISKKKYIAVVMDNARANNQERKNTGDSVAKTEFSSSSSGKTLIDPPTYPESAKL